MTTTVCLTDNCSLRGFISHTRGHSKDIHCFLGIPYAAPPLGRLRFKPPEKIELWKGVKEATEYGAICHQNIKEAKKAYFPFSVPERMSEDCLFLNIWSPDLDPKVKLPVMVWIHGGSYVIGFSDYYDGTALATFNNVLVISINYRLGILGFLCNEAVGIHGNMGLLDQLEALRWIQKYISRFGGDPNNVTLFGESAGAISISGHVLSPLAKGLFHRAICQSGTTLYPSSAWTKQQSTKYWMKRLRQQGLQDESREGISDFLNNLDPRVFAEVIRTGAVRVIDGYYLPDDPKKLYSAGRFNPVDLIVGFNSSEGLDFVQKQTAENVDAARKFITWVIKHKFYRGLPNTDIVTEAIIDTYITPLKAKTKENVFEALVAVYGDLMFVAPTVQLAEYHSGQAPTFLYHFNHRLSFSTHPPWATAGHGDEILLVFGEPFLTRLPDMWTDEERSLSRRLMTYWTNFAKHGHPSDSGAHEWPRYDSNKKHVTLDANFKIEHYDADRMALWNKFIPSITAEGKSNL